MNETINWFKESGNELIPCENPTIDLSRHVRLVDDSNKLVVDDNELCIQHTDYYEIDNDEYQSIYIERRFKRKETDKICTYAAGLYRRHHRPKPVQICEDYEIAICTINDRANQTLYMFRSGGGSACLYNDLRVLMRLMHIYLPPDETDMMHDITKFVINDSIK